MTDVDLHEVLNVYRKNDASLVSLYFSTSMDEQCVFTVPGPKSKNKLGEIIYNSIELWINPSTPRIVFVLSVRAIVDKM